MFDPDEAPQTPRAGSRAGAVMGAGAAALVSAGLVYWLGSGGTPTLSSPTLTPVRSAYAPAKPDAGQVVRAYEQLQEIYADGGGSGVAGFARSCANRLSSNPAALDFCVAFDIFAASLVGDAEDARAWREAAEVRDLAMARAVLPPTQDPTERLGQIRELARQASLQAPDLVQRPAQRRSPPAPKAKPAAHKTSAARPAATRIARAQAAERACRRRATAAQQTVCASPALRQADQLLHLAYRRALAAGADPQRLARDQARFRKAVNTAAPDRVAVERLYYKRTRALETFTQSP